VSGRRRVGAGLVFLPLGHARRVAQAAGFVIDLHQCRLSLVAVLQTRRAARKARHPHKAPSSVFFRRKRMALRACPGGFLFAWTGSLGDDRAAHERQMEAAERRAESVG
jgi:hypothetical protein